MKKTVWLIDADMTLFDFKKAERAAFGRACGKLGIAADDEATRLYSGINDELWKALERGEITQSALRVERFVRLRAALGAAFDPEEMNRVYTRELGEACFVFAQAPSLLRGLKRRGCKVCVLTNGITDIQKRRFALSGLGMYVDALVISQEEGVSKPDARIVERALERVGCADKKQAVIVGDSLTSDMAAARNAQVDGIWYDPAGRETPKDNTYIKARVRELHELMQYV